MCARGRKVVYGGWGKCAFSCLMKERGSSQRKGKGKLLLQGEIKKEYECFFCKKKGHMKKKCPKFKAWLEKKGNQPSPICNESNMVDVYHNTW